MRVRGKYFAAELLFREENGARKCVNFPRPMSLAGWRCHTDMSIPVPKTLVMWATPVTLIQIE